VRSNRLGLPKDICDLKAKEVKSLKGGEPLYRQKDTLTCVTWRDRKPVSVLGIVPTSEDDSGVVERSTKVSGHWVKENLIIIIILHLTTCHLGAESLFKCEHETNYK